MNIIRLYDKTEVKQNFMNVEWETEKGMKIVLRKGNIAEFDQAEAIVNAANSRLYVGAGVCGAIHSAGGPEIERECKELRKTEYPDGVPVGESVATTAGNLSAEYVIHAVGPHYTDEDHEEKLAGAYLSALRVAEELDVKTVAFPAISTGIYGYPSAEAAPLIIKTLNEADADVEKAYIVLYDDDSFLDFFIAAIEYSAEQMDTAIAPAE